MSGILTTPTIEFKVGGTTVEVAEILECDIHLGCTREVSSFEVVVDNSNPGYNAGDYSPGGAKAFTKGNAVTIKIKRGTISSSTNYLITGILESLEFIDQKEEYQYKDVVVLRGRCKGYQLFARKYDGDLNTDVGTAYQTYKRASGEAESLIAYLIDNYTSLTHTRVNSVATANANKDQKVVAVTDGSKFAAGDLVKIYDTNNWEYNKVASVSTNNVTMVNNLLENYTTAATLTLYLDLIRDSNTTYTKMLFSHETIFDILKFISDTASTSGGAIGYDMRIEYDGEFGWLPRGHVTESYTLAAQVQLERYMDDATRIKNKITVYGKPDKPAPLDSDGQDYSDGLTELAAPSHLKALTADAAASQAVVTLGAGNCAGFVAADKVWIMDDNANGEQLTVQSVDDGAGTVTMTTNLVTAYAIADDAVLFIIEDGGTQTGWGWYDDPADYDIVQETTIIDTGSKSIEVQITNKTGISILLQMVTAVDMNEYDTLKMKLYFATTAPASLGIGLRSGDCGGTDWATIYLGSPDQTNQWVDIEIKGGTDNEGAWSKGAGFSWSTVKQIRFFPIWSAADDYTFYIDRLHFIGKRWGGGTDNSAVDGYAYDATSVSTYGVREHVIISEMLLSDAECEAKAQSLLAFYKDARIAMELETETLDLVNYPILPGNKVAVDLTPLSISGDYRIDSVDIHLSTQDNSLKFRFFIDNAPPRTADYLFRLSRKVRELERSYGGSIKGVR